MMVRSPWRLRLSRICRFAALFGAALCVVSDPALAFRLIIGIAASFYAVRLSLWSAAEGARLTPNEVTAHCAASAILWIFGAVQIACFATAEGPW